VIRVARTFASGGTVSGTNVNAPTPAPTVPIA